MHPGQPEARQAGAPHPAWLLPRYPFQVPLCDSPGTASTAGAVPETAPLTSCLGIKSLFHFFMSRARTLGETRVQRTGQLLLALKPQRLLICDLCPAGPWPSAQMAPAEPASWTRCSLLSSYSQPGVNALCLSSPVNKYLSTLGPLLALDATCSWSVLSG